jgi:hypothetical protein
MIMGVPKPKKTTGFRGESAGLSDADAPIICRKPSVSDRHDEAPRASLGKRHTDESVDVWSVYRAAHDGDPAAQLALASIYDSGQGLPMDRTEAATWCRRAADQGNSEGQFQLACRYTDGHGVPEDPVRAIAWMRMAASLGHADAQFCVGRAFQLAEVVPRDDAEALLWLKRAAEQGHVGAQYFIDEMAPGHEKLERELVAEVGPTLPSASLVREVIKYLVIRDNIDGQTAYEAWLSLRLEERASLPLYDELMAEEQV